MSGRNGWRKWTAEMGSGNGWLDRGMGTARRFRGTMAIDCSALINFREEWQVDAATKELIQNYVAAVHRRFEQAIALNQKSVTEGDRAFFDGAFFCYQDTMKLLRQQLEEQGYNPNEFEPLEPVLPEAEKISYITPSSDQEVL
ncbi:MAG: hypothetical protein F6K30_28875 [Cyanothece sp. SIO2G6]|nr:hypothetical protein [Cyanothece sp. SIO2G6]